MNIPVFRETVSFANLSGVAVTIGSIVPFEKRSDEKISSFSRLLDLASKQVSKAKGDFTAFVSESPGCKNPRL